MNHTDPAGEPFQPTQSPLPSANRRRIAVVAMLSVCAGVIWILASKSPLPPAVTILPPDFVIPPPPLPVPDRWIPMTWGWLWKLRNALLGKAPVIDIETKLVLLGESTEPLLREALTGHPHHSISNGVRSWILSEKVLVALGHRFEEHPACTLRISRLTSGPGVLAKTTMLKKIVMIEESQIPVGDSISYAITKHGGTFELTGAFTSWEAVTNTFNHASEFKEVITLHTNLMLAAKMNIPHGKGVFLYDTNRANAQCSGVGVLINAKLQ